VWFNPQVLPLLSPLSLLSHGPARSHTISSSAALWNTTFGCSRLSRGLPLTRRIPPGPQDHYLHVPFDLSRVVFVATANDTRSIPPALLDRMEVIPLSGYTADEKLSIALQHLVPRQLKEHGLSQRHLVFPEDTLTHLITGYTREAGVRPTPPLPCRDSLGCESSE
jgi:hypothetical protein